MIFVRQKEKERLFPDSIIMAAINTRKESRTGYLFRAERGEPPRGREVQRPSTNPLRTRPCPVAVGRDVLIAPPSARAANPRTALARVHFARALPCGAIGISRPFMRTTVNSLNRDAIHLLGRSARSAFRVKQPVMSPFYPHYGDFRPCLL